MSSSITSHELIGSGTAVLVAYMTAHKFDLNPKAAATTVAIIALANKVIIPIWFNRMDFLKKSVASWTPVVMILEIAKQCGIVGISVLATKAAQGILAKQGTPWSFGQVYAVGTLFTAAVVGVVSPISYLLWSQLPKSK